MQLFTYEPKNWTLKHDERLLISYIESHGDTLEQLIENALVSIEDWNGNEGPLLELQDLSKKDFTAICGLLKESLIQLPVGQMNKPLNKMA